MPKIMSASRTFDLGPIASSEKSSNSFRVQQEAIMFLNGNSELFGPNPLAFLSLPERISSDEDVNCVHSHSSDGVHRSLVRAPNSARIPPYLRFGHPFKAPMMITIPSFVREVADRAFYRCMAVSRVTFEAPTQLECIGVSAFSKTGIRHISIPDSVRQLSNKCFHQCPVLGRVTFTESSLLEYVGVKAFHETCLRQIVIPNTVRELDNECFCKCWALKTVIFDDNPSLERIGARAFAETELHEIFIPDTVRVLDGKALYDCRMLSRVKFGPKSRLERLGSQLFGTTRSSSLFARFGQRIIAFVARLSVPDSVTELPRMCFHCFINLKEVLFGRESKLERIGQSAFAGSGITSFHIPSTVRELGDHCFDKCLALRTVTFGEVSLDIIPEFAFAACYMKRIHIPDSVRVLGDHCFGGCTHLSHVTFGPSSALERIGVYCFGSARITDFNLPSTVTDIGGGAFSDCSELKNFVCGDNCHFSFRDGFLLDKTEQIIYSASGSADLVIPDGVRELSDYCFNGHWIDTIKFGESPVLERIGIEAFSRGNGFNGVYGVPEEIDIPDSVVELGDRCFHNCPSLKVVRFGPGSSLLRIGVGAFDQMFNRSWGLNGFALVTINIPDGVREIPEVCFRRCTALTEVKFGPNSELECLGVEAFVNSGLRTIIIPDTVRRLQDRCFEGCKFLCEVLFNESSKLESIGTRCFAGTCLSSLELPKSVTTVSGGAFVDCHGNVTLKDNNCFSVRNWLLLNKDETICYSAIGSNGELTIPDSVEEIGEMCFFGSEQISSVIFSGSSRIKRIGYRAFSESRIGAIIIPASVCELGTECFRGCSGLATVTFEPGSVLERIGDRAFSGGEQRDPAFSCFSCNFETIEIPDSVREIGDECFFQCSLAVVTFGEHSRLERIGVKAFYQTKIRAVSIPKSVQEIGDECFGQCEKLVDVKFDAESCARVGVNCFEKTGVNVANVPKGVILAD